MTRHIGCFYPGKQPSRKTMIINGDAISEMKKIDALSVDAIITDPPFFTPATHYQSRISWGRSWADLSILGQFFFDIATEFKRILNPEGHLFIFCHDESYPVLYPAIYGLWDFSACLIWDKLEPGLGKIFRHRYEMILWASNKGAKVESDGKLHTDVLAYKATRSNKRKHPVQKPSELIEELLTITTQRNDFVLDPFAGSGSVGVACKKLGRKFLGIDLDPEYCRLAETLIDESEFQSEIFPIGG